MSVFVRWKTYRFAAVIALLLILFLIVPIISRWVTFETWQRDLRVAAAEFDTATSGKTLFSEKRENWIGAGTIELSQGHLNPDGTMPDGTWKMYNPRTEELQEKRVFICESLPRRDCLQKITYKKQGEQITYVEDEKFTPTEWGGPEWTLGLSATEIVNFFLSEHEGFLSPSGVTFARDGNTFIATIPGSKFIFSPDSQEQFSLHAITDNTESVLTFTIVEEPVSYLPVPASEIDDEATGGF